MENEMIWIMAILINENSNEILLMKIMVNGQ